jgi:hypothetical protein
MLMEVSSDFRETGYELKAHIAKNTTDCQSEESITLKDVFQAVISLHFTFFCRMGAV